MDRRLYVCTSPARLLRSKDHGERWLRLDKGLPRVQAWFTVLCQAMCADAGKKAGAYFDTTGGAV